MESRVLWDDRPPERDGVRPAVRAVAFRPDGRQVAAGAGNRVHLFRSLTGVLLRTLKAHRGPVYAVAYSPDGDQLATAGSEARPDAPGGGGGGGGGSGGLVVLWNPGTGEGVLRFSHGTPVVALAWNPATGGLATGAGADVGLWHAAAGQVRKRAVESPVLCLAWRPDGAALATGHVDGTVVVRDRAGAETARVRRPGPAACLRWAPPAPGEAERAAARAAAAAAAAADVGAGRRRRTTPRRVGGGRVGDGGGRRTLADRLAESDSSD